jgi:hypothetical protein
MNAYETLLDIELRLSQGATEADLLEIRTQLQSRAFREELKDYFRTHNHNPEYEDDLIKIGNLCDERRAERVTSLAISDNVGTGSGIALIFGGIFAAISLPVTLVSVPIITIFGGGLIVGRMYLTRRQLSSEALLYEQISKEIHNFRGAF